MAVLVAVTSPISAQPAPSSAQPADLEAARDKARPLAAAALAAYDAGRFADAITGFLRADAIFPAPQYRIYLARAYSKAGKSASAARAYAAALAMKPPVGSERVYAEVQSAASAELAQLRPRVPVVKVTVLGAPAGAALVTVDGAPVETAGQPRLELDPGVHTIVASAPGFVPATSTVNLPEGTFTSVEFRLEAAARDPLQPQGPIPAIGGAPARSGEGAGAGANEGAASSPYSHRWKPGVTLRTDIDPVAGGALFVPGLTFGILDHGELVVSALVGRDAGIEPAVRIFFLRGAWKPLVEIAAPIFVVDGARAGVRGAAGVQWDFHRHFGVFAEVGGAFFPEPPPGYESGYFLPSVGVQGRL